MAVLVRNPSSAQPPPAAPAGADGRPYRFEMIHAGGNRRGYADDPAELVAMLIPEYAEYGEHPEHGEHVALPERPDYIELATDAERAVARVRLVLDMQVRLQAQLAAGRALDACTEAERAVLLGPRHEPPAPSRWEAPVPLVLISTFYEPTGPLPRPSGPAALQVWLDPADDWTLLTSLHTAGLITVNRSR
jgi:hypothetical protein